ncbi:hypothetical protein AKJ44_00245 [candidate division MSBL1 archaeon SCGC-AAA261F17]|uniref:DOD-type homing endonuclease domain-containing protein n=1 Tax=candidate division MSBL1 archaeon SCGC-AAA261F17 TaxID=1698274 RepID=A0A133V7P6_9EURY|nr:hypothetical protein AKJ44_00245 [candidate division MSBL1 archaeon SCGC-AAA261F17]
MKPCEAPNANKTCWNCPAAKLKGNVDFRACGQSKEKLRELKADKQVMIECKRRPELGHFEPTITFEQCPEWESTEYGYMLRDMRVMILGIDGYLGWTLALKLGNLGCNVSGIDNHLRREMVSEKGSHSIVPIKNMEERLQAAKEVLGIDIDFRKMDLSETEKLRRFLKEVEPEAIVHYAEIPSAPYSMIDMEHAVKVQRNNVLNTLRLLYLMKDITSETSLIKLGTLGEYGSPLTGRPLFEGIFPADATLEWEGRKWSMGGELTPRDPVSFYHVSKTQDTFNVYEACKYFWLRSYDVMQGVIFGVHTEEVSADPRLRTRLDVDECVPPNTSVITNFDTRPIKDIENGDRVLTHRGSFKRVTKTFNRPYSGEMVKIDVPYVTEDLSLTPNHPVLVVEKKRKVVDGKNEYSFSEPFWMNAGKLLSQAHEPSSKYAGNLAKYQRAKKLKKKKMSISEIAEKVDAKYHTVWAWFNKEQQPQECKRRKIKDLYLVRPIPSDTEDIEAIDVREETGYGVREGDRLYTPNPANQEKKWGKWIPAQIMVDESFLKFAGYYLAEGSCGEYHVEISFGKEEDKMVENAENSFQRILGKAELIESNHKIKVKVSSKAFARLVNKLFGAGARFKRIPDWGLKLPLEKQKVLIRSYWEGDGWESEKREGEPEFCFSSNSSRLIHQLQLLLLRFRIISSLHKREREIKLSFEGREPYTIDSKQYQLSITGTSARKFARKILGRKIREPERAIEHARWEKEYCLIPIRNIWKENYDGEVLNLEVENDNSYNILGHAVHNCFGTVINRFASQAALGIPLTVYGEGEQIRGFIALEDAMECMVRLIISPPEPGQYDVVNQVSGVHKIKNLADTVARVSNEKFDLDVKIQRLENPRVEADRHPFEAVARKLPGEFGFVPKVSPEKEVTRMLELLTQPEIRERIREKVHLIIPETFWSGEKREADVLEVYQPGTKEAGIFTGKLNTVLPEDIVAKIQASEKTPVKKRAKISANGGDPQKEESEVEGEE